MKILYFNSNKNSYKAGETVTFFWEVENAERIVLHPYGDVEAKGIKTIVVPTNTSGTFTTRLIASSSSGNIEEKIELFNYAPIKDLTSPTKTFTVSKEPKTSEDSLFSTIIQYIVIGVIAIVLCGVGYDYVRKNNNPFSKESKQSTYNNSSSTAKKEQNTVSKDCNFSSAYTKTDAKINALLLTKISDDETLEETDNCSVTYKFFVKQRGYDIEGKEYTEDKVKHLFLTYRKIGTDFEFVGGKLFSGVNETEYRSID